MDDKKRAQEFTDKYLQSWVEPDQATRHEYIRKIWAPDGQLCVSDPAQTIEGVAGIIAHVDQLYGALSQLRFVYDQHIVCGDALLLRWSIFDQSGQQRIKRGVNIVWRDESGCAQRVYMFMNVE